MKLFKTHTIFKLMSSARNLRHQCTRMLLQLLPNSSLLKTTIGSVQDVIIDNLIRI
jgi:hypothetical protein